MLLLKQGGRGIVKKYALGQRGREGRREVDEKSVLADLQLFRTRKARFIFFKD